MIFNNLDSVSSYGLDLKILIVDFCSGLPENDLMLMNTPPNQKPSTRSVARHPAARALQEQVDGDGAPREAHIMDKMLFSPQRGEDGKVGIDSFLTLYKFTFTNTIHLSPLVWFYKTAHLSLGQFHKRISDAQSADLI